MKTSSKLLLTAALLLLILGLGAADTYLNGGELAGMLPWAADNAEPDQQASGGVPEGGVAKMEGPDVVTSIESQGFSVQTTSDESMISQVVAGSVETQSKGLLRNGDRVGAVIWIDTPEAKTYFSALKDALLAAFTPGVQDLRDVTLQDEGTPVRNILTFLDPGLSEERLTFVRVRERIYEFHTAKGQEAIMDPMIEAITKL